MVFCGFLEAILFFKYFLITDLSSCHQIILLAVDLWSSSSLLALWLLLCLMFSLSCILQHHCPAALACIAKAFRLQLHWESSQNVSDPSNIYIPSGKKSSAFTVSTGRKNTGALTDLQIKETC